MTNEEVQAQAGGRAGVSAVPGCERSSRRGFPVHVGPRHCRACQVVEAAFAGRRSGVGGCDPAHGDGAPVEVERARRGRRFVGVHDTITARSVLTWIVAKPLANGLSALVWPA